MNYEQDIQKIASALALDKTTNPKWRNKIVSRLEEAAAMCHKLGTREVTKGDMESLAETAPVKKENLMACTCTNPGRPPFNPTCPSHGL
jgi:hypothetical protein